MSTTRPWYCPSERAARSEAGHEAGPRAQTGVWRTQGLSPHRRALGSSPPGAGGGTFPISHGATSLLGFGSSRKSSLMVRAMDFVTSTAILSLLCGCVGIFSLFKLLQCLRVKAHLQDAVVVITGATSGLGRGGSRGQCCQAWKVAWLEEPLSATRTQRRCK